MALLTSPFRCALLATCISAPRGAARTPTGDYLAEIAAARQQVIQTGTLTIQKLELGSASRGKNRFSATVKNRMGQPVTLMLDLRADPGLWLRKWQQVFLFPIGPREEKEIQADYEFARMSEEAWLRVRFAFPRGGPGSAPGPSSPFFEKKYYLGRGNRAVDYDLSRFEKRSSVHLDFYYFPDSPAAKEIGAIADGRESAFRKISEMLGVTYSARVRLFLFPDAETKKQETGHTGAGYAFANNIVEVYNPRTRLDPFHELTHILAGELGEPPAMFNEGFAVYISELMGDDALENLGAPGMKVDEAVMAHRREGKFIPLDELFAFTDIGPEESRPEIAYPEAASVVKYLIGKQGLEKFRRAYKSLENTGDAQCVQKNRQTFREIYGKLPSELEQQWLKSLPASAK